MILQNITQVFTRKSESVRVKRGCKFWPWRPCLRAIFFSRERYIIPSHAYKGKEILFGGTEILQKEVWKSRISAREIPKLLRQDQVANPIFKCGGQTYV